MVDSRIPGFYKLPLAERRRAVSERTGVPLDEVCEALDHGGLEPSTADKVVENVLGVYALPFGVALNFRVNGVDHVVPMVVEEPSVIAAASNAARIIRAGGGFHAECPESLMTGQIELREIAHLDHARARLAEGESALMRRAAEVVPGLVARGGGPRSICCRGLDDSTLVVEIAIDCRDAMGANLVNSVCEAVGPLCAELAHAELGLRILTNLNDRRRVRVRCSIPARELPGAHGSSDPDALVANGRRMAIGIERASRFAELDPYRAATHNKGIMNGIDAVVLATGNDFRAIEAGAHAFAARDGRYSPLARWRATEDGLDGELELPLSVGIVGGTLRVHPTARLALALSAVRSADELAMVAASCGLASNLAALRALATEGIQRGHMSLHARSVATAAGAQGDEVDRVARRIAEAGKITVDSARVVLDELRRP